MDSPLLPPATDRLWSFLCRQPALAGFVLVGGTALALRIRHRLSEDLDFAWPGIKLPRLRLEALIALARAEGHEFVHRDNPAADDEFTIAGMELRDYQQDYLVNGTVKVSFFSADEPLTAVLVGGEQKECVRVAEVTELFQSKALVSASRSKTRDWFDLYVLMRNHGFSMEQFREAFATGNARSLYDTAVARICSGVPQADDEGFDQLVPGVAPPIEEMRDFFRAQRDALEVDLAARAKLRHDGGLE